MLPTGSARRPTRCRAGLNWLSVTGLSALYGDPCAAVWFSSTALFAAEPGGSLPHLVDRHALLTALGEWEVSP